jgi:hypothetical protein
VDDGHREHRVAGAAGHRHGLAGQDALVDDGPAAHHLRVDRDAVAVRDHDAVARLDGADLDRQPPAVDDLPASRALVGHEGGQLAPGAGRGQVAQQLAAFNQGADDGCGHQLAARDGDGHGRRVQRVDAHLAAPHALQRPAPDRKRADANQRQGEGLARQSERAAGAQGDEATHVPPRVARTPAVARLLWRVGRRRAGDDSPEGRNLQLRTVLDDERAAPLAETVPDDARMGIERGLDACQTAGGEHRPRKLEADTSLDPVDRDDCVVTRRRGHATSPRRAACSPRAA